MKIGIKKINYVLIFKTSFNSKNSLERVICRIITSKKQSVIATVSKTVCCFVYSNKLLKRIAEIFIL